MVLWLHGAPPSNKMKEMLQTKQFHEKVKLFISSNIQAYLHDTHGTSILSIPQESHVAFL
jgi:hypothetical protein